MNPKKQAILWGATGQARVVRPILEHDGYRIIRLFDNNPAVDAVFTDIPFGGPWEDFVRWQESEPRVGFAVCIGGFKGKDRIEISRALMEHGHSPLAAIHERSWISPQARIGVGVQVLAMAAICEGVILGDFSIVNVSATISHSCVVGAGVHIMPGATIAGAVEIGDCASLGANSTVLPRLRIGANAVVGAGAVVTKDVPPGITVTGSPARPL